MPPPMACKWPKTQAWNSAKWEPRWRGSLKRGRRSQEPSDCQPRANMDRRNPPREDTHNRQRMCWRWSNILEREGVCKMGEVRGSLQCEEACQTAPSAGISLNILWRQGLSRSCLPHDDMLVLTMLVANYTMRRILIDNGSSVDILFWNAFSKMGISVDQLQPAPTTLKGFTRDTVQPIGSTLLVFVGTDPHFATTMTKFLVVRTRSAYNAIIGKQVLALEWYVKELKQWEREVRVVELKEKANVILPPTLEMLMIKAEIRNEDTLKQGEAN